MTLYKAISYDYIKISQIKQTKEEAEDWLIEQFRYNESLLESI